MINYFMPTKFKEIEGDSDIDIRYKSRILVNSIAIVSVSVLILCILQTIFIGDQNDPVNTFFYISIFFYLLLPFYLKKTGDYLSTAKAWILMASFGVPLRIITTGGFASPIMPWFGMISVASVFFVGKQFGIFILSIIFVEIGLIEFVDWKQVIPFPMPNDGFPSFVKVLGSFFAFFCFTFLVWLAERERKEWKAQWQDSVAHVTASSKLATLGEMAGGIAHEINTPLTVISISAAQAQKVLEREKFQNEIVGKNLSSIVRTTDRIAKIVAGLRTFARDASVDPFENVKVATLIQESLDLCQLKFTNHHVQLQIGVVSPELIARCKSVQISQVLLNLLNNSFDAIADLDEKWIRTEVEVSNNQIMISIVDSGHGIPSEIQKKLFQPFFSTKEVGRGTGLGLSISLGIMHAHGGNLVFDESAPNTTFRILLPLARS